MYNLLIVVATLRDKFLLSYLGNGITLKTRIFDKSLSGKMNYSRNRPERTSIALKKIVAHEAPSITNSNKPQHVDEAFQNLLL